MTVIDITDLPAGMQGDLAAVEKLAEIARATAVSEGTFITTDINVHCPSQEAVDSAAAQWGVEAAWNEDRTQYRAVLGNYRISMVAVWIPLRAVPAGEDGPAWPPSAEAAEHALPTKGHVDKAAARWTAEGRAVTCGWEGEARYAARTVDAEGNVQCAFWRFAA